MRSPASASGERLSRTLRLAAISRNSYVEELPTSNLQLPNRTRLGVGRWDLTRGNTYVADTSGNAAPDHDLHRHRRRCAHVVARNPADEGRYLPEPRDAGDLRRAAVRRHGSGADGGVHRQLLRV